MVEKSRQSEAAISLPKGGGAIKGIGETFQPNLFTGTGNFSVPIYTSPGRSDFGPKLSLQYSTGNGNGPFGLGWQLSVPRITRKTEKGLPTYTDNDVFILSGAEDLVPMSPQPDFPPVPGFDITYYRPRTEGLFARIAKWTRQTESGHLDVHWRVTTKENITSIYGKSNRARIHHPEEPSKIFEWLLEETFDAKGNHILYEYLHENPRPNIQQPYEKNREYTQVYLRRILYGNTPPDLREDYHKGPTRLGTHHDGKLSTVEMSRHYLFEVLFDYGDLPSAIDPGYDWRTLDYDVIPDTWFEDTLRPDPFSSFRASFEIRTLRRCKRVLMLHHFNEGELIDAPVVKATEFSYDINVDTRLTFLTAATMRGYRKDPQESTRYLSRGMPPVSFKYSEFKPHEQHYQSLTAEGGDLPPVPLSDPNTTLMDIFGNALPDIVQTTVGRFDYWENQGNGRLARRRPQTTQVPTVVLSQPGVSVGDIDGDGLVDLIVEAPPMSGAYETRADGTWQSFKRFEAMPSLGLDDPDLRLVDLTGDGLSDALVTRDGFFLWYRSNGEHGFDEPRMVRRQHDLNEFPDVYFSDSAGRVRLADMSGDGLNDIVLAHDGRIDYWPNLGYGKFGKRLTMTSTPHIGQDYDPKRLFLADLDGSGSADLVYVENNRVRFWFNRSGNGWSEEQVINGTPYVTDLTGIHFADVFGTGTATLLWSYDYARQPGGNYKALDFCGGVKPNLLIEMDNNMGATTRAHYASSTKFYLLDKEDGRPWVTHLPFPVQVLEKTETIDHISNTKLVTRYEYHHGYYDGKEREFRGFGRVDQIDTEFFDVFSGESLHKEVAQLNNANKAYHVPPVLTKTWFHTGIYFDKDQPSANGVFYDEQDMMAAYEAEFYNQDAYAFQIDPHTVETHGTPHEAFRALRGSLIRTEVYAQDGTGKEKHPYVVTDNRYTVKRLQAINGHTHAVYITSQRESIAYHYERIANDPRVSHQLTLEYDEYGNITESVSIAYPRRTPTLVQEGDTDIPHPEQQDCKAVYTYNGFINKVDEYHFRYAGVPCETKVFEVHGIAYEWPQPSHLLDRSDGLPILTERVKPFTKEYFKDIRGKENYEAFENDPPEDLSTLKKRLIDWKRNYFRADDAAPRVEPSGYVREDDSVLSMGTDDVRDDRVHITEIPGGEIWAYWNRANPAGGYDILMKRRPVNSTDWIDVPPLVEAIPGTANKSMLTDSLGNVWLFWNEGYAHTPKRLLCKRYSQVTQHWTEAEVVEPALASTYFRTISGIDGELWLFTAGRTENDPGSQANILYKHYQAETGWDETKPLEHRPNSSNHQPSPIIDADGRLWLFWSSCRQPPGMDEDDYIYCSRWLAEQEDWGEEVLVHESTHGTDTPTAMLAADGTLWLLSKNLTPPQNIVGTRLKYGETQWHAANPTAEFDQPIRVFFGRTPPLIQDKTGDIWAFWSDTRAAPGTMARVIGYNRYRKSTAAWEHRQGAIFNPTPNDGFIRNGATKTSDGRIWVSWTRHRGGGFDVGYSILNERPARLALGEINSLALPYESYQVAFNEPLLEHIFEEKRSHIEPGQQGGYHFEDDFWWIPSGRQAFDPRLFYLPTQTQDPFGAISEIVYDRYALLTTHARDALPAHEANVIHAKNDYRVLQPFELTDPNGNRSQVVFDAHGLVVGTAMMGKESENVGDSIDNFDPDLDPDVTQQHIDNPLETDGHNILQQASTRLVYDLHRYRKDGHPNVVYTLARETHYAVDGDDSSLQHSFVYSDGFGREAQRKVQAEPGPVEEGGESVEPRWVGTGLTIYNNKGKPVQQYEPFFSDDSHYGIEKHGVSRTLFYDPLERAICTVHPNHSYEKVVFDSWQQQTWDANDTLLLNPRTDVDITNYVTDYFKQYDQDYETKYGQIPETWYHERIHGTDAAELSAAQRTEPHAGTPTQAHLDSMGRTFLTIQDNGGGNLFKTHVQLDIEGNDRIITDPRDIPVFVHQLDLAGRKLRIDSRDSGSKWLLISVDEQPIHSWDANSNHITVEYDALRRPTKTWITRAAPHNDRILAQVTLYGERLASSAQPDPAILHNHRGRPYLSLDGAGIIINSIYDFKGNSIEIRRALAHVYDEVPDWQAIDLTKALSHIKLDLQSLIEQKVFITTNELDALNRVTRSYAPDHTSMVGLEAENPKDGSIYQYVFNEAKLLDRIEANLIAERVGSGSFRPFVRNVNYNARGQREVIVYGNGVITKCRYDNKTFRQIQLSSQRSNGDWLQDLHYTYDPVGNITQIRDQAITTIWYDQQKIEGVSQYSYDSTYRLITSSGREHKAMGAGHYRNSSAFKQSEYQKQPPTSDAHALQMYAETYTYDPAGNITEIKHHRGSTPNGAVLWTRAQNYDINSNHITISGAEADDREKRDAVVGYAHDANGNYKYLPHLGNGGQVNAQNLHWDYQNQLIRANLDLNNNVAHYNYDASGQRIRKVIIKGGIREERIYLGKYEIYRKFNSATTPIFERQTLHIMDDKQRIALVEHREIGIESVEPATRLRYQLVNHLGTSVIEIDVTTQSKIISYEEYYPYSGTAYIGGKKGKTNEKIASTKRYRYSGKERDDETGLYYYGARYYAPWLGRWCSADPLGIKSGNNMYLYVNANPIKLIDLVGLSDDGVEFRQNLMDQAKYHANTAAFKAGQNIEKDVGRLPPDTDGLTNKEAKVVLGESKHKYNTTWGKETHKQLPPQLKDNKNIVPETAVNKETGFIREVHEPPTSGGPVQDMLISETEVGEHKSLIGSRNAEIGDIALDVKVGEGGKISNVRNRENITGVLQAVIRPSGVGKQSRKIASYIKKGVKKGLGPISLAISIISIASEAKAKGIGEAASDAFVDTVLGLVHGGELNSVDNRLQNALIAELGAMLHGDTQFTIEDELLYITLPIEQRIEQIELLSKTIWGYVMPALKLEIERIQFGLQCR